MRRLSSRGAAAAVAVAAVGLVLPGCGLEGVFANLGHEQYERPASKISGLAPAGITLAQLTVIDGDGTVITPFQATIDAKTRNYELRLPSAKYSMLRVRALYGNADLRAIVPFIGQESAVSGVDLDPASPGGQQNITETIIVEARLSANGDKLKNVTPEAYLGTRKLIQAGLSATSGPTVELLSMVQNLLKAVDPSVSVSSAYFFVQPVFDSMWNATASALDKDWLLRNPFDYVGDGRQRDNSAVFDGKLAAVAQLYRPAGCPDPDRIRMVFTVDFNQGSKNGNCGSIDRFHWSTDKPGKSMFFVGWIHLDSELQENSPAPDGPNAGKLKVAMGTSTPNTIPMYDDGTNGDEKSGDGIWTVFFDAPRSGPGKTLRIGYKYTWGTQGAPWTGSEEWPGNSRILEVVDDNKDDFVYRHDVYGDEASNKDKSNLNLMGGGSIDWKTDLHNCGTPESHENKFDNNSCKCGAVLTPKWIGPLTLTCS